MLIGYFKVQMGLVGVVSYCPLGHFEDGIASH